MWKRPTFPNACFGILYQISRGYNRMCLWIGFSVIPLVLTSFVKKFLLIYSHVHTLLGPFLPLASHPFLLPHAPLLPSRTHSALISNIVEEKI
jgi:hypothetical protein